MTLVVENCEINAHKMILSACSPYFNAMFQSFEESKQNRICLQQIDSKALNLLIEFIYTSEILINEENVQVFKLNLILSLNLTLFKEEFLNFFCDQIFDFFHQFRWYYQLQTYYK